MEVSRDTSPGSKVLRDRCLLSRLSKNNNNDSNQALGSCLLSSNNASKVLNRGPPSIRHKACSRASSLLTSHSSSKHYRVHRFSSKASSAHHRFSNFNKANGVSSNTNRNVRVGSGARILDLLKFLALNRTVRRLLKDNSIRSPVKVCRSNRSNSLNNTSLVNHPQVSNLHNNSSNNGRLNNLVNSNTASKHRASKHRPSKYRASNHRAKLVNRRLNGSRNTFSNSVLLSSSQVSNLQDNNSSHNFSSHDCSHNNLVSS